MYSGKHWKFTPRGIEAAAPPPEFTVPSSGFTNLTQRDGVQLYEWPIRAAESGDVPDLEEFLAAYADALTRYEGGFTPLVDPELLDRSIEAARRIRQVPE